MASKPKRPGASGLRANDHKRNLAMQIGLIAVVVIFAVGLISYIVLSNNHKRDGANQAIRVTSAKLVTKDGTGEPKAVLEFYEDFLCPACGNLERAFGPTVSRLIDSGAIAADYHMVAIVTGRDDYSMRAGAAAYCVADESNDAFRRFHTALYTKEMQPEETDITFPDNNRLIELARQAGAGGSVPACINSGKYLKLVDGMARAGGIHATPTLRINGEDYRPSTPEDLVAKIREIVGDVPGMEATAKES
ncbi:thioredoxin domain-containing protein [Mycolicibacter sp. MYC123]|uniref:Thioredoxin domain-containing protein n=1 Tax=[Mycobacterium] zoologicum TaxID=2872311 RepID=A0ABU5YI02_9MYCO|nr:thioredoxin domain-containing protein [Mycolicibacter sp. MYC123]MEB3049681.1 thioredoxin domain-containing protein [Mycolicibacter sp. MYC123]